MMTQQQVWPAVLYDTENGESAWVLGAATTRHQKFAVLRELWDDWLDHGADDAMFYSQKDGRSAAAAFVTYVRSRYADLVTCRLDLTEVDGEWWWTECDGSGGVAYTGLWA
jgi:hypothetical protein